MADNKALIEELLKLHEEYLTRGPRGAAMRKRLELRLELTKDLVLLKMEH